MSDVRIDQAARLAREWANLGTMEWIVREDNSLPSFLPVDGNEYRWIETHYVETPARQRFLEVSMKNTAGKTTGHKASYSDGRRNSIFDYRKEELDIPQVIAFGTSFDNESSFGGSSRPEPLRYYFVDKTPLHEALPNSVYLGNDKHLGSQTHVFLFKDIHWGQVRQDLVLHLAEDDILPHKMIFYKNEAARLTNKPLWTWSATKVESIQGKNIPTKSRRVNYETDSSEREMCAGEITVQKVEFGKTFPQSTFWRENDPRATVFDSLIGKITPPKVLAVETNAVVGKPIHVDPVSSDSNYYIEGGLAIIAAALGLGLVRWLRRV